MKSFDRFLAFLAAIPDPRRAEGKRYEQRYVLLFSILAVVTGANSYRGIQRLNKCGVSYLLNLVDPAEVFFVLITEITLKTDE